MDLALVCYQGTVLDILTAGFKELLFTKTFVESEEISRHSSLPLCFIF